MLLGGLCCLMSAPVRLLHSPYWGAEYTGCQIWCGPKGTSLLLFLWMWATSWNPDTCCCCSSFIWRVSWERVAGADCLGTGARGEQPPISILYFMFLSDPVLAALMPSWQLLVVTQWKGYGHGYIALRTTIFEPEQFFPIGKICFNIVPSPTRGSYLPHSLQRADLMRHSFPSPPYHSSTSVSSCVW